MIDEDVQPRGEEGEPVDSASRSARPALQGDREHGALLPAGEEGGLLRRRRAGGGEDVQEDRERNPDQGERAEE